MVEKKLSTASFRKLKNTIIAQKKPEIDKILTLSSDEIFNQLSPYFSTESPKSLEHQILIDDIILVDSHFEDCAGNEPRWLPVIINFITKNKITYSMYLFFWGVGGLSVYKNGQKRIFENMSVHFSQEALATEPGKATAEHLMSGFHGDGSIFSDPRWLEVFLKILEGDFSAQTNLYIGAWKVLFNERAITWKERSYEFLSKVLEISLRDGFIFEETYQIIDLVKKVKHPSIAKSLAFLLSIMPSKVRGVTRSSLIKTIKTNKDVSMLPILDDFLQKNKKLPTTEKKELEGIIASLQKKPTQTKEPR